MRLLIVSNMSHYRREGEVVGWGPTVQEIDQLARLFDEVVHVGNLHEAPAPASALPYRAPNVRFVPVPPSGGGRLVDKLKILTLYPRYARTVLKELRAADAVHVRCPANISLLAVLLLGLKRSPERRWIKYAGNWQPYEGEAWTYRLQRRWLQGRLHRGAVTVNGRWPGQPAHVHSFVNPCLTADELREGRALAGGKAMSDPVRLLFVGALTRNKGADRAVAVLARLAEAGQRVVLDVVGDGPDRPLLERLVRELGVADRVTLHGWVSRDRLVPHYAAAHLLLLPSLTEGWPKVLSEAMAFGVVPIASSVGSIPQYLAEFGTGRSLDREDAEGFVRHVRWYAEHPEAWKEESERGLRAAERFSYPRYLEAVRRILELPEPHASAEENRFAGAEPARAVR